MFEQLDVVLKFARKKLAGFTVKPRRRKKTSVSIPSSRISTQTDMVLIASLLRRRACGLGPGTARTGALDQPFRKSEQAAQAKLPARHPAVVVFVIVAGKVQQAMQDESLDFGGRAVS